MENGDWWALGVGPEQKERGGRKREKRGKTEARIQRHAYREEHRRLPICLNLRHLSASPAELKEVTAAAASDSPSR